MYLAPELTSWYDQPLGASAYPQLRSSENIVTPKDNSNFILVSLTNRSHQVNSRSLLVPCFTVVVYDETERQMLNAHLSYKPPSYWRRLFWSGGRHRQFINMKKFRALVVPGGCWLQGVIIKWRQLKRRFSCGRSFMLGKKRECNRSVCTCTQTEE